MFEPLLTCHALSGAVRPVTPGLLAEIYLAPRTDAWPLSARVADGPAPWAASFAVAPTETALAVERALRALISATASLTPGEVDPARLPQSRARSHLEALQRLWLSLDGALPADLAALAHVLSSDAADALEPLALLDLPADPFASAAETALRARLTAHHGLAPEAASEAWTWRRAALSGGGRPSGSLAHLQTSLLAGQVAPLANDGSLAFFGLRDLAQEADFAAALSQALLDDGRADDPAEIGLLVPDEPGYMQHLTRAFDAVGIPLSGAAQENPRRDVAGETLLHALLALRTPAPSMALASLYLSPLMPWPTDTGQLLAREVMQRRFTPRITKTFTGPAATLFRSLRDGARTNRQLRQRLDTLSACLTEDAPWSDQVRALRRRIPALQARLAATPAEEPAWDDLLRFAVPSPPVTAPLERWVEGVSLFSAGELPWRGARHLIVMGFAGERYPGRASSNPFFLDSELEMIRESAGLRMPGQADQLAFRLELFRRQLSVASETATFLSPYRSGDGARVAPSTGLSLAARTIEGATEPERLVQDLRATDPGAWPCRSRHTTPLDGGGVPVLPRSGQVSLGRDLLALRRDDAGQVRPQSPSRLENLLVSPLAWLLGELDALDVPWSPETLDVLLKGTLAHDVMENLFPAQTALPEPETIPEAVARLLAQSIRRLAPFLQAAPWSIERKTLEREILRAARNWRTALAAHGAEVLANEITLAGDAHGIIISGRADCILRLDGGRLLIVDHKKSGSKARRARMEAGWDLQLGLYRAMLMRPVAGEDDPLRALLDGATPGVAYHLMNDSGILQNGLNFDPPSAHFDTVPNNISEEAIEWLLGRLAEVGGGQIQLNGVDDEAFFKKTAKLTPYALENSPLIAAFRIPPDVAEEAGDD